ncbi:MAG: hypothetical protein JKY52_00055 [Flavobacteriales bacterium]|nr:hypothetical protein [Flavobacteriales bacterium]
MNKADRIKQVNTFIRVMADNGRRFFYSKKFDRYGHFFLGFDGHLRWRDEYTNKAIYLTGMNNWHKGFTNGGTLQSIVKMFTDYIRKGKPVNLNYFRNFKDWRGDVWGYGEAMTPVTEAAQAAFGNPANSPLSPVEGET